MSDDLNHLVNLHCVSSLDDAVQVTDDSGENIGIRTQLASAPNSNPFGTTVFLSVSDVKLLRKVLKKWLVKHGHA